MSNTSTTPWWGGTNFWVAALMATAGLWFGFSEGEVNQIVGSVIGLVGFVFAIRERVKNVTINWKAWILNKNTWNYLFAALSTIVVNLPAGIGEKIAEILQALAGKNYAGVITGFVSLGTILWVWLQRGRVSIVKTSA